MAKCCPVGPSAALAHADGSPAHLQSLSVREKLPGRQRWGTAWAQFVPPIHLDWTLWHSPVARPHRLTSGPPLRLSSVTTTLIHFWSLLAANLERQGTGPRRTVARAPISFDRFPGISWQWAGGGGGGADFGNLAPVMKPAADTGAARESSCLLVACSLYLSRGQLASARV